MVYSSHGYPISFHSTVTYFPKNMVSAPPGWTHVHEESTSTIKDWPSKNGLMLKGMWWSSPGQVPMSVRIWDIFKAVIPNLVQILYLISALIASWPQNSTFYLDFNMSFSFVLDWRFQTFIWSHSIKLYSLSCISNHLLWPSDSFIHPLYSMTLRMCLV